VSKTQKPKLQANFQVFCNY